MPLILPKKKPKAPAPPVRRDETNVSRADCLWPPHPRAMWELNDQRNWPKTGKPYPGSAERLKIYDAAHPNGCDHEHGA